MSKWSIPENVEYSGIRDVYDELREEWERMSERWLREPSE